VEKSAATSIQSSAPREERLAAHRRPAPPPVPGGVRHDAPRLAAALAEEDERRRRSGRCRRPALAAAPAWIAIALLVPAAIAAVDLVVVLRRKARGEPG
jgi:hypothetical protein